MVKSLSSGSHPNVFTQQIVLKDCRKFSILRKRPWINAQGANTEEIIKQVDNCPSGALSYLLNNKEITTRGN